MAKKKAVNWVAIKKRYLQGERPKEIAEDYGLDPKAVTNKAYKESWGRQKEIIKENVSESIQNDLKELSDLTFAVHKEFMRNLQGQMNTITNPYLFDGERTNSLFQTAMNNSVKLILAAMKTKEEETEEETPGFNVMQDAGS